MKLFSIFRRRRVDNKLSFLRPLESFLKYKFKDPSLLLTALTHRSLVQDSPHNYERLEFLGDAVLDHVISEWLYIKYPKADEGFLTKTRSRLVNKVFLSNLSLRYELLDYIQVQQGVDLKEKRVARNLSGDIFESIIGAMYIDGGIEPVSKFIKRTVIKHSKNANIETNFKGLLIEFCHQNNYLGPVFKTLSYDGPEHNKVFTVVAIVNDNLSFNGKGRSKRGAEQNAAKNALDSMNKETV
ncbi:MAG: ribonuclease III [Candidatus Marinimicrobia bacterium]|nr:ribonuclease III [Candidatus Neomarinimicrobiota bacterium]MBL7023430.1 ribonuclease III [Candidatus Neomarinimicrobiota bacterium]MBL7108821.1 ribonuclease III [Candidatus Neomarinimicrobiota bacterium]